MKKKFLALAMVILIAVSAVSAIGFQLGASWNTGFPLEKVQNGQEITVEEFFEPNGMNYGPEVRLDLSFIDIGDVLHLSWKDDSYGLMKGMWIKNEVYADINVPILFLRLGLGMGLQTDLMFGEADMPKIDFLEKSNINYRGKVGFMLGPIELDVLYTVPSKTPVQAAVDNEDMLADIFTPAWDASRIGVSLLYSF